MNQLTSALVKSFFLLIDDDQYNESADVVLEYMGNEIKTNDMIQTFADIDHYLKYEMENLKVYVDHVENMISLANSATKKNISEITKKSVRETLEQNFDMAVLSKTLATIEINENIATKLTCIRFPFGCKNITAKPITKDGII